MLTYVTEEMPELFWQLVREKGWTDRFVTDAKGVEDKVTHLIVRTYTIVDDAFMSCFKNLEHVIRAGTGYDNIHVIAAAERGVAVSNTPAANGISAYEQTIGFVYSLIKNHRSHYKGIRQGTWRNDIPYNMEVADLRVLVVGLGFIGSRVAKTLKMLGAEVRAVDPYCSSKQWEYAGIEQVSYEEGLQWTNMVTYHCQLTRETVGYFTEETLGLLDNNVWLINAARGGIIDEDALLSGLKSGKIKGAAIDVFEKEPDNGEKFKDFFNVIMTPHTGAFTSSARVRLSHETLSVWSSSVFGGKKLYKIDKSFCFC